MQSDGKIVLAGRFQLGASSSSPRAPLFRLNADGSTDTSYAYVTTLPSSTTGKDLLLQPDGKAVSALGGSVYRFLAAGGLDPSFSVPVLDNYAYATPSRFGGTPYTVSLRPDGRILFCGHFTDVNLSGPSTRSQFGVAQLNPDGTLDSTFAVSHKTGVEVFPTSFTRLADADTLASFGRDFYAIEPIPFSDLGRLHPSGQLDPKFSLSSPDPASVLTRGFIVTDFVELADGRLFTKGTDDDFQNVEAKFLVSGEEDLSFWMDERRPAFQKATALSEGRLLLSPETNDQATVEGTLTRLRRSGELDPDFQLEPAIRSSQTVRDAQGNLRQVAVGSRVLAVQPDGKILLVYLSATDQNFHLVRLEPNGSLDGTFSGTTLVPADLLTNYPQLFDPVQRVTLQPPDGVLNATVPLLVAQILPDGKIVVAGQFTSFRSSAARSLIRLLSDGTVDSSFHLGGGAQWIETQETPAFFPAVETVAIQADGRLLIAGTFEAFDGTAFPGLASLQADGTIDASYSPLAKRLRFSAGQARLGRQPDGSFLLSGPYSFPEENEPSFIHLNSLGGTPVVGSPSLAVAVAGQSFSYQIVASGQPTSFNVTGLPAGFSFDSATGLITGNPGSGSGGTYSISITATGAEGTSATHLLTLTIAAPPMLTSASSATGAVGQPFQFQIEASNQPTGFRATDLPSWLALDPISGLLSGTPPATGVSQVPVRALNEAGADMATLTVTINGPPPPPNDNFADAQLINGSSGTIAGSNAQATREAGEPNPGGGFLGGRSVWYRWTAPNTRNYSFGVSGSSSNKLVAAYTGSIINNLTPIAGSIGSGSDPAQINFTALAGTTYRITVDGLNGASGDFILDWQAGSPVHRISPFAGNPPGDTDGPRADARFFEPADVAFDGAGNFYIADSFNRTIRKVDPAGVVSTLAGLSGYPSHTDGIGSAARFRRPRAIVCDASGNVFATDSQSHTIRKITPGGEVTTIAGWPNISGSTDGLGAAARFSSPEGIAVDDSGNLYVADAANHTIRKITPAGLVSTIAGVAGNLGSNDGAGNAARFSSPRGIAADRAGNLYVADTGNHTIRKITSTGSVTTVAGLSGSSGSTDGVATTARFNGPAGITVDASGFLYVADSNNSTIRKISPAAEVTTFAGSPGETGASDGAGSTARFNFPRGLKITEGGDIYLADTLNHTIRQLSPSGVVTTFAGRAPGGSEEGERLQARFRSPWGCALDASHNLYVADTYNQTIRKITPAGIVSILAGETGSFGSADGQGNAARFGYPTAVTVANDGALYVADYSNRTIRKITPSGLVSTLAGSPGQTGSADGQGSAARFNNMFGIASDSQGNVYVADTSNHTIRKITPAGLVSTLAGLAGAPGSSDGIGSTARFSSPSGIVVDSTGNVFVGDADNYTIRKITPDGTVSTYAGLAGNYGTVDGMGSQARLSDVRGLTISAAGTLFATDGLVLRQITAGAAVTTIAGDKLSSGWRNGVGTQAQFNFQNGLAVDTDGTLYLADTTNGAIRSAQPVTDLQLATAVSRKTHGGAGPFDINLPLTGEPGVECRNTNGTHTVVFTFSNEIASADVALTSGTGSVAGQPAFTDKTVTVNLTSVSDQQKITIALSRVTDAFAQVLPYMSVSANILIGDANGNKNVNSSDIGQTKSQSGVAVTAANFRSDVNVSGTLTASDVSQVKANAGHTVP